MNLLIYPCEHCKNNSICKYHEKIRSIFTSDKLKEELHSEWDDDIKGDSVTVSLICLKVKK